MPIRRIQRGQEFLKRFGKTGVVRSGLGCIAFVAAVLLTLVGCGATDSDNVRTGGVRATLMVEATGDGTSEVSAKFTVGSGGIGGTNLDLKAGDSATASANGIEKTLRKKTDALGGISYDGAFDFDAGETLFRVALNRANDTSAPNSTVRLTEPFAVTLPENNQRFALDDALTVAWSPSGYGSSMDLVFVAKCPSGAQTMTRVTYRSTGDDGSYSPGLGSLIGDAAAGLPPGSDCRVEMEIARSRSGQLDPNYGEGGTITAAQKRDRTFFVDLP